MTKKNIVLVLLISIFLSVMLVTWLGTFADASGTIYVETLTMFDIDGNVIEEDPNADSKKTKYRIDIENKDYLSSTYYFKVELAPNNASNLTLNFGVTYSYYTKDIADFYEVNEAHGVIEENTVDSEDGSCTSTVSSSIHYFAVDFKKSEPFQVFLRSGDSMVENYLNFAWHIQNEGDDIDV